MDLSLATFVITLRLQADVHDRYALLRLKRPLQQTFQAVAGCKAATCERCVSPPDRICTHAFASPLSTDPAALRRYQKPSPPFVFHVPFIAPYPNKGTIIELGLSLLGSAVPFAEEYLSAVRSVFLEEVGFDLSFEVIKIEAIGYGAERVPLHFQNNKTVGGLVVMSSEGLIKAGNLDSNDLSLCIETPLRLLDGGRLIHDVTASRFLRALMRRVSSLVYYYGGIEIDADFKWLARLADRIVWSSPELTWNDDVPALSGIMGTATLHGDLSEFHPFLLLGEFFHLGKGAAYGLGRFRLIA